MTKDGPEMDDDGVKIVIAKDRPDRPDVADLLAIHLAFAAQESPPEHVHALDVSGLMDPSISFWSACDEKTGEVLGVGALKELDDTHGELKSMHTRESARGRGVGRAILHHLLELASFRGYDRVSLETGSMEIFAPARALYASVGFVGCAPYADYVESEHSICMTLTAD